MAASKIVISGGSHGSHACHCPDEACNEACQKVLHDTVLGGMQAFRAANGHVDGDETGSGSITFHDGKKGKVAFSITYEGQSKAFVAELKKLIGAATAHQTLQGCKGP